MMGAAANTAIMGDINRRMPLLPLYGLMLALAPLAVNPFGADSLGGAKWTILHVVAVVTLLGSVRADTYEFPGLQPFFRLFFAAIVMIWFLQWGLLEPSPQVNAWIQRISFFVLVIGFYQCLTCASNLARLLFWLVFGSLPVVALWLSVALGSNWVAKIYGPKSRELFFGNVNLTAEYLGSIVIAALFLSLIIKKSKVRIGLSLYAILCLFCVWTLASRSAIVSVFMAALCLFATFLRSTVPRKTFALAALCVVAGAIGWKGSLLEQMPISKGWSSVASRLAFWQSTVQLIKEQPWGVGLGNFQSAIWPYRSIGDLVVREDTALHAPHNEYLRIAAEDGIVPLLMICGLLAFLLWRVISIVRASETTPSVAHIGAFFLAMTTYWVAQVTLQFSLLNAMPVAVIALTLAGASRITFRQCHVTLTLTRRLLAASLAAASLFVVGAQIGSEWIYAKGFDNYEQVALSCRITGYSASACGKKADFEIKTGGYKQALHTLKDLTRRIGDQPPLLKLNAIAALARGDIATGCKALIKYDRIFGTETTLTAMRRTYCFDWPAP